MPSMPTHDLIEFYRKGFTKNYCLKCEKATLHLPSGRKWIPHLERTVGTIECQVCEEQLPNKCWRDVKNE